MIDQLRTTHLTLLLICLVLVAANVARQRGPLRLAYEDAVKIAELRNKPTEFLAEVRREIDSIVAVDELRASAAADLATSPSIDVVLNGKTLASFSRADPFLAHVDAKQAKPQLVRLDDIVQRVGYWDRFDEFIDAWDTPILIFQNPLRTAAVPNGRALESNCGRPTIARSKRQAADERYDYNLHYVDPRTLELSFLFDKPGRTVDEEPATCRAAMTLEADGVPFDVREAITSAVNAHWPAAPFREAFRNLDESTNHLKSLSATDLIGRLNEEANREGDKVELFGAKIPFELVSVFGSLLLVSCQFYLWCHLIEYRRRLTFGIRTREQDPSGYIGCYGDQAAVKAFVALSVFLLPIAVQGFALWKTMSSPYVWLAPAAGAVLSMVFGGLLWGEFRKVWGELARTGSALLA